MTPDLLFADDRARARTEAAGLVVALRDAHEHGPDTVTATAAAWRLQPMTGARNNHVYRWTGPDSGQPQCVKVYKVDERRRIEREWNALTLLAAKKVPGVPRPVWCADDSQTPIMAMTMVPGVSITDLPDPLPALTALPDLARQIHAAPLVAAFRQLPRVDSAEHFVNRINRVWPEQLLREPADPLADQMGELLRWWRLSDDAAVVCEWTPRMFSHGDSNLLNWLWDGERLSVVDFEFSGYSDLAFDAAELVEHISARPIADTVWDQIVDALEVTDRRRYLAARRTCAMRWLAVLWKHRVQRPAEFAQQHARVVHLRDTLR